MRALVLCSGTGSIDRALERQGWTVESVDWLPKFQPTMCVDILNWDYKAAFPKDHFDFVWSSPQCTMFSVARTTGPPADIEGACALVARCLEISAYYGCPWALENPQTGSLKAQPLMAGLLFTDVTYCKYNNYPYRKATRLWHSEAFGNEFTPRPLCCKALLCVAFAADGVHPKSAQRGPTRTKNGIKTNDNCSVTELYSIPPALCDEIVTAVSRLAIVAVDGVARDSAI